MNTVTYLRFEEVNPGDFLPLLNSQKTRKHLIDHELFTVESATAWINDKKAVDDIEGCRVRAVMCGNELAGWCGIQYQEGKYEIAIVIDERFWGLGRRVFRETMDWAKELGHEQVVIHFLHTRPNYKFLQKIASKVYETEIFSQKFTSYQLPVK